MSLSTRIQHAWNAFLNRDPTDDFSLMTGASYSYRPDRPQIRLCNDKTIINAIYNRISVDVASVNFELAKLDENHRYKETVEKSGLNTCLTLEANVDQTARAFILDIVLSMLDEGCVAVVPIDTSVDPNNTSSYDILTMRTGKILQWYPDSVQVRLYNDRTGRFEELVLKKKNVAIIENPFYTVMNEYNSTMQRLIRKLSLLDYVDEQSGSGKLDLIIQLPYAVKTPGKMDMAEKRRSEIEQQLTGSKYGIAYIDGTEKVIQLNRSLENNLLKQVEDLTSMLYSQLGVTQDLLAGTANESAINNYYSRTIEPILEAIKCEFNRKFLTQTARTQGQSIYYFKDPFKMVPVSQIADIADKFTRNEIMTSNEVRALVGMKPAKDPNADELRNKNLNQSTESLAEKVMETADESSSN